jgi:hypothetical protein
MVLTQAPINGFRPWLAGMAPWLKGGGSTRKICKTKMKNKCHIRDSPVIAIVSILVRLQSRSSGLPPLSGSAYKSIPKVLIKEFSGCSKVQPIRKRYHINGNIRSTHSDSLGNK